MWSVASMFDSSTLTHHFAYLNSGEHVQTERLNVHRRPDIPVSSHSPIFCQPISTATPGVCPFSHQWAEGRKLCISSCLYFQGLYKWRDRELQLLKHLLWAMRGWFERKIYPGPFLPHQGEEINTQVTQHQMAQCDKCSERTLGFSNREHLQKWGARSLASPCQWPDTLDMRYSFPTLALMVPNSWEIWDFYILSLKCWRQIPHRLAMVKWDSPPWSHVYVWLSSPAPC